MDWAWLGALALYAVGVSWLALRKHWLVESSAGSSTLFVGLVGLAAAALGSILSEGRAGASMDVSVIPKVCATAFGVFLAAPFLAGCIGTWYDSIRAWFLSLHKLKLPRMYDLAEKAVHEKNIDEAIRLYRDVYGPRDPADPTPHFRLGDLYLRQGCRDEAAKEFQASATLESSEERALIAAFRAAELLPDPSAWLESLRPRFAANPKLRELLDSRLKAAPRSSPRRP